MCELESWIQRASVDGGGEKKQTLPPLRSMPTSEEKAQLKACSSRLFLHMEPHDSFSFSNLLSNLDGGGLANLRYS